MYRTTINHKIFHSCISNSFPCSVWKCDIFLFRETRFFLLNKNNNFVVGQTRDQTQSIQIIIKTLVFYVTLNDVSKKQHTRNSHRVWNYFKFKILYYTKLQWKLNFKACAHSFNIVCISKTLMILFMFLYTMCSDYLQRITIIIIIH